jgi:vancomycin resistance protein VanJ
MERRHWRVGSAVTAVAAVALTAVLALHRLVPGALGTALDSGLPWLGLLVPALLAVAALRRSSRSFAVCLLPAVFWAAMFGPVLVPRSSDGHHDLRP